MNDLLQFTGLTKQYGSMTALAGVNLTVEAGSILALLGPNGAGKSTLFGCLLGLTRPTAGEIRCGAERIGYLPERLTLYPQRTVWDNGRFFARLKNQPDRELECQLQRVGLFDVRRRKVRQLSKGMLQRVGLAIALCGQPDLLILDEPFNGLDPAVLEDLQRILLEEHQRAATLLIATHTISAVEAIATHVAIILQGKLAMTGPLEEVRDQYGADGSLEKIYHQVAREHGGARLPGAPQSCSTTDGPAVRPYQSSGVGQ